jgi:hypothetical protein
MKSIAKKQQVSVYQLAVYEQIISEKYRFRTSVAIAGKQGSLSIL